MPKPHSNKSQHDVSLNSIITPVHSTKFSVKLKQRPNSQTTNIILPDTLALAAQSYQNE